MESLPIYLRDFKPEKQKELIKFLGGDIGNYDVFPITTLQKYDDEDEE